MALSAFDFRRLATMDGGRIAATINQALLRATDDCRDRPSLKAARKVTITLEMSPVADDSDRDLVDVEVDVTVKETAPARSSRTYSMSASGQGLPLFNELSPDDVRQGTLDGAFKNGGDS